MSELKPTVIDKHVVNLDVMTSPSEAIVLFAHHVALALAYFEAIPHDAHNLIAETIREKHLGLGTESAIKFYFNLEKEYNG